jgi:hypothetical protein
MNSKDDAQKASKWRGRDRELMRIKTLAAGIVTIAVVAGLAFWFSPQRAVALKMKGYSAVLLDNNSVYFGKVADLGSDYPVLTDVFYIQSTVNQETKQQSNILVKRGKEWHAPDKMILNARHIIMIEPVTDGSTVAKLIDRANGK